MSNTRQRWRRGVAKCNLCFLLYMAKKSFAEYPVFWHPAKSYILSKDMATHGSIAPSLFIFYFLQIQKNALHDILRFHIIILQHRSQDIPGTRSYSNAVGPQMIRHVRTCAFWWGVAELHQDQDQACVAYACTLLYGVPGTATQHGARHSRWSVCRALPYPYSLPRRFGTVQLIHS
jgi:hypothetical protein